MSTAATIDRVALPGSTAGGHADLSPRTKARLAGALYLLTILGGLFGQGFVSDRLVDVHDAARTASNIVAHESLFRLGFTVFVVELGCQMAMTVLLYELLAPAGRGLSRLALTFGVVGCTIKLIARVLFYAPLLLLAGSTPYAALGEAPTNALALLILQIGDRGAAIAMAFFGAAAILRGWLIFRSTFLPRALGVLSILAGTSLLSYLWPPLGYRYFPVIGVLGLIGSVATIGWLLIRGVDEARWREQAREAATSLWR